MVKLYTLFFSTVLLCAFLIGSCKTVDKSSSPRTPENKNLNDELQLYSLPIKEHLTERVWVLAGIKIENDFMPLDANMRSGKLNFLPNEKFKATSGITVYYGTWGKGIKKSEYNYNFSIKIDSSETIDYSNTIGKPFDEAFRKNLEEIVSAEINRTSIKFYSKNGELILHFIRI